METSKFKTQLRNKNFPPAGVAKYRQPLMLGNPWFTFSRDRLASHKEFQGTSGTVETEGRRNVLCPKGTLKEVWTWRAPSQTLHLHGMQWDQQPCHQTQDYHLPVGFKIQTFKYIIFTLRTFLLIEMTPSKHFDGPQLAIRSE